MNRELQSQHEQLIIAYRISELRYQHLTEKNAQMENALREGEEERNTLQIEIGRLRNELALRSDQSTAINQLNAKLNNYEKEIYKLRNEKSRLNKEKETLESDLFTFSGRMNVLERSMATEKKESDERHQNEIDNLKQEHGREVERLNRLMKEDDAQITRLNEELRNKVDSNTVQQKMNEYETALQVQRSYIADLRDKLMAENMKQNHTIKEYQQLEIKYRSTCEELNDVKQRLSTIENRNREDLDDRSCLICTNPMDGSAVEFQQLPRCYRCRRRYHRECISTWFREKPECPVCKAAANEMENVH